MARAKLGRVMIDYASVGEERAPAVILISGWKGQKTFWSEQFVAHLVDAGYRVITIDNRDAGKSGRVCSFYLPPAALLFGGRFSPIFRYYVPYRIEDMADDVVALMDHLHISSAHVVGFSLGGMISQVLAASYPNRVLSLTLLGTTTNRLGLPMPPLKVIRNVFLRSEYFLTRKQRAALSIERWKSFGTPDGHQDTPEFHARVEEAISRGMGHMASRRQFAAGIATGDLRAKYTKKISAPTLVLHGTEDGMLSKEHGEDIAANIEKSRLEIIDGWGHDLAPSVLTTILPLMVTHLDAVR